MTKEEIVTASKLTNKQEAFVDYYVGEARFNASEAARLAGYSDTNSLHEIASQTLRILDVQAAIKERLKSRRLGVDECLALLEGWATGSLADFVELVEGYEPSEFEEGWQPGTRYRISLEKAQRLGKLGLLKKLKCHKDGSIEIELHDPQAAVDKLLKVQGAYTERVDVTSKGEQIGVPDRDETVRYFQGLMKKHMERGPDARAVH